MPSVLAPYDTATGYLGTRSGVKSIGLAAGMTGATASSRYVGATSSGAPDAVAPTYRDAAVAPVMPAASPIDFTPERVLR